MAYDEDFLRSAQPLHSVVKMQLSKDWLQSETEKENSLIEMV